MKTIILDYGVGNLKSVHRAIESLGITVSISSEKKAIESADILVLPGQGAFEAAMSHLKAKNLIDIIKEHIAQKKPYLGICLGLQLLFDSSEENNGQKGLGIFEGQVKHFKNAIDTSHKIPHMGWNTIDIQNDPLNCYQDLPTPQHTYFVHSYYVDTPDTNIISTKSTYGINFTSSIQTPHLLATQFHPEKSGQVGLKILDNFFKHHLNK